MFKNKKTFLVFVVFIALAFVLFMTYRSKVFRLESITPEEVFSSDSTIVFKFNNPVSNRVEIVRDTKIEPSSTNIFIFVEGDTITIKPLIGFSLFTDYKITIPVVSGDNQKIKNVSFKFKVNDLDFNKLSNSEKRVFENNFNKFTFMNKLKSINNKDFEVEVVDFETEDPGFILSLKPNIDNYGDKQLKLSGYSTSFKAFSGYLKPYNFSSEDLNLYIYPSYLQDYFAPLKNGRLGD